MKSNLVTFSRITGDDFYFYQSDYHYLDYDATRFPYTVITANTKESIN